MYLLEEVDILTLHQKLSHFFQEHSDTTAYHFYLLTITPILDNYKKVLQRPVQLSFMGEQIIPDTSIQDQLRISYLTTIAAITTRYSIDIQELCQTSETIQSLPSKPFEEYTHCTQCTSDDLELMDRHLVVCKSCGNLEEMFSLILSNKEEDRVNVMSKYTYEQRVHFKECIYKFQGKQNVSIPDKVFEELMHQIQLQNLLTTDQSNPYKNVTKKHIVNLLKELKYSKYYEDIHLIYHKITGHTLPDIGHIEEQLMNDFDRLISLYKEQYIQSKKIERKSFLHSQYVLYQLLKRHKFECKPTDFNLLKTIERKLFHDNVCSDLFKQLGWNFTNVF